ncbi:polysaccharide lyase family 7 protein [Lentzea sp. NPDC051213]|uniref:polysaccharide lyase family 7 protein n=1 Tax=Lentzea sp. NPDC051213 TaxID=3364126 RepID=UPI0037879CE7
METPALHTRRSMLGLALTAPLVVASAGQALAQPPSAQWVSAPYSYTVQKPWNLAQSARYSFTGGVHTMWVYDYDEPHTQGSPTDPRTELRFNTEYTSGQRAWQGEIYVPSGVSGPTIVQILRETRPAGTRATDIMLNVTNINGGTLRKDSNQVIATGIYNKWFTIRIEHTAVANGTGTTRTYYNGSLKLTHADEGPANRYFKNGVYHHGSGRAEARFRNITYWRQ